MRWKIFLAYYLTGMALSSFLGCRGPQAYIHPNVDLSFIQKVAVMPFANLTRDEFAGRKVREVLIAELLLTGALDVAEPGEVNRVLAKERIESISSLTAVQIKTIGKALGAQAILIGTVEEFGEVRSGSLSAPLVTIGLRMMDIESGTIIWSVNHSKGGVGIMTRLLGIGGGTISDVTTEVVREAIDTLFVK
jgi:TolB-like protein